MSDHANTPIKTRLHHIVFDLLPTVLVAIAVAATLTELGGQQ